MRTCFAIAASLLVPFNAFAGDQIGITRVDGSVEPTATLIEGMAPQLK